LEKLSASYKERSPGKSLSGISSGIDNITKKISRDIEKEKIRVEKTKEYIYHSKEKHRGRDESRER
jgi:hypothetical protein